MIDPYVYTNTQLSKDALQCIIHWILNVQLGFAYQMISRTANHKTYQHGFRPTFNNIIT